MHDDHERSAEESGEARPLGSRMELTDASAALALAERAVGSRVLAQTADASSADGLLAEAQLAAEQGERVAVVVRAESLAASREAMRRIAQSRLAVVAHAIAGHGGEELAALSDLGWGVLCASGPEDSFDLALVARRAAEDAGVPFVVVHPHGHAEGGTGRAHAMVALPQAKACQDFVGPASRMKSRHDPAHPSLAPIGDRAFSERVPFALGSALREYANVSGRRHDMFDKMPLGEAPLMLVGMGPLGDALIHAIPDLRARGYDVGAVHVSTLRPFPGARLVKALARALAVTVLEPADEPMAHGGLLARELKSAFTDALTWAPGFPGIGRIPKLFVGVTGASFDVHDLASICDNMLADERGRRSFSFADADHRLPVTTTADAPTTNLAIRWVLDDVATANVALAVTAAVLASALGLRTHGLVTPDATGGGATVDLVATREHARGAMARRGPRLVLATERAVGSAKAVAPLVTGTVLAVLSGAGDPNLPDAARVLVRERRVRALALAWGGADEEPTFAIAATCAGAALAAGSRAQRTLLDPIVVARLVAADLTTRGVTDAAQVGPMAERARRAFEATLEALGSAERDGAARPAGDDRPRSPTVA